MNSKNSPDNSENLNEDRTCLNEKDLLLLEKISDLGEGKAVDVECNGEKYLITVIDEISCLIQRKTGSNSNLDREEYLRFYIKENGELPYGCHKWHYEPGSCGLGIWARSDLSELFDFLQNCKVTGVY